MSIDDLLITIVEIDAVAVTQVFGVASPTEKWDVELFDRGWVLEDTDEFTVAQWVYYDPIEYAKVIMEQRYGTVRVGDDVVTDILKWETIDATGDDGFPLTIHYAVRDGDEYEQAIMQLEGASK
jgi:hypothetical protein